MRIGFIGAGRVGFTMGKFLTEHGVSVSGYFSRTPEHAMEAAKFTDTVYFEDVRELIKNSDAVILTVSDNAIRSVFESISQLPELTGKIVCHTSGATSSLVFNCNTCQVYGYSIHPIYAVSDKHKSYMNFSNAFITIEGSPEHLDDVVCVFRETGLKVGVTSPDSKLKYHAASVVVSNLVCGMFSAGVQLLEECGFDEESAVTALTPLFRDNAIGVSEKGVIDQLTGPLERNDTETVRGHLEVLDEDKRELYIAASKEVIKLAKKKNPDKDYTEMEGLL
ncbi:MAG: DUF2520 domain-containing protein [Eubacterium sp.]|nr:DUF2520 domain-containing protein [Eubacterium sp.]